MTSAVRLCPGDRPSTRAADRPDPVKSGALKALAIGVALLNFAPILFLGAGLFFLAQLVDRLDPRCRRMSLAGLGLVVLGGLAGAASDFSMALSGEGIPLLATLLYVFGAPGMALVAAALLRARATVQGRLLNRDPWLVPSLISWTFLISAFYLKDSVPGEDWKRALASLSLLATAGACLAAGALGWRRQLQATRSGLLDAVQPSFVPAVLEAPSSPPVLRRQRNMLRREVESNAGMIEVSLDGMTVRIGPDAPSTTIAAVLRALKDGT